MKIALSLSLVVVLFAASQLAGQGRRDEEKTVIELKQPEEEQKGEPAPALIGMEAYREVLVSGRYLIGPGDEFLIYVTGMDKPFFSNVLAEGGLFIPYVGSIPIGGLRLHEAHRVVEEAFRRAVNVGEITFELSKPRFFPVPVVGMVEEPGVKMGSGVDRVSELILKAGGLLPVASSRNIRILKTASLDSEGRSRIRAMIASGQFRSMQEMEIKRVDLDLYQVTGESRFNPFLEDGDVVLVPAQIGQVGALGAVQRPDFYEFVEGDRISDLLTIALGPAPSHDSDNVLLFRYTEDMITRATFYIDLQKVLAGDPEANLLLQADDWLNVREIPGYHQKSEVRVVGEVVYPGYYVVGQETTSLQEIIERAGGFTENASLSEARIARLAFVEEEEDEDPEYERIRYIPVTDRTEDEDQYFIMKSREKAGQMAVDFVALFKQGDEKQNILLMPGDVIVAPTLQRTVMVSGQVAQPGAVIYDSTYSVWDYIERTGGLGWRASKDIRIIKARTGEIQRIKDEVQIQPGDRIWIKEKPERDYWSIFTQAMQVVGQVSTVVLLYATLTN